jgi:hypothetical protein
LIEKLDSTLFTWSKWRANDFFSEFGVSVRHSFSAKQLVREKAIGYCDATLLSCRPKYNCVAVMFWDGNNEWWTHLTLSEFEGIFS